MTLTPRDQKALAILAVALPIILGVRYFVYGERSADDPGAVSSIPVAEKRLARLRQIAAALPAQEDIAKRALAEVVLREKGLVKTDTAAQAQAELLLTVRRLGKAEGIDIRGGEMGAVREFGDAYGEVATAVTFECRIEQLVNLLSAIANEPALIGTNGVRVNAANPKEKTVTVRLDLGAIVPRTLVSEKKGPSF